MDILGLPLHPLIVHGAVVLVPLAALGALLLVALPRLRAPYGSLTGVVAASAAASALGARFTGPLLADELGLAGSSRLAGHQAFGLWAPWPALLLAIVLPLFLWAAATRQEGGAPAGAYSVSAALTVASALAGLVLIVLTGHSGATAVWGG